jgi:hypothetical protein
MRTGKVVDFLIEQGFPGLRGLARGVSFPVFNMETEPPTFEGNPETPYGPIKNRLGE